MKMIATCIDNKKKLQALGDGGIIIRPRLRFSLCCLLITCKEDNFNKGELNIN